MKMKDLRARDVMSTELRVAAREETLRVATRRMAEHGVHCLLVEAEEPGRAPAIITGKDIVQVLGDGDDTVLDDLCVADALTAPAITVPAELALIDAVTLMQMAGVRAVFVTEGLRPIGLLSFTDVLRAASEN